MTTDLRAELASVLGAMREFLTSGYDAVERELVEQWNSRLAAISSHGGKGKSELRNLLNRAAAALETPNDLSQKDKAALIEDLCIAAEHGGGGEAVPFGWVCEGDLIMDKAEANEARDAGATVTAVFTAPQPRGEGMVVDDALVRKVLDFKPSWSGVTLREYLEEGGVKYWSPSSYVWNDTHSKPYRMVQEVLRTVLAAAPGEGSGEPVYRGDAPNFDIPVAPPPASQSDTGVHASHCCAQHGCKYGESDCPVACGNIAGIVCEECEEASQSAPSDGGGPEPGEPAPPPSTPAQHYLASVNGVATQEWQDGFNEASRLASAPASQSLTDKVSALLAEHSLSEVVVALQRANDSVVLSYLGGKELG